MNENLLSTTVSTETYTQQFNSQTSGHFETFNILAVVTMFTALALLVRINIAKAKYIKPDINND